MIPFACKRCHYSRQLDDNLAGKKVKCPKCGSVLRLPGAAIPQASSPTPSPAAPSPDDPFSFDAATSEVVSTGAIDRYILRQARRVYLVMLIIGFLSILCNAGEMLTSYNAVQMAEKAKNTPGLFYIGPSPSLMRVVLIVSSAGLIAGLVFVGLAFWARNNPLPPAIIGLVIYVIFAVVATIIDFSAGAAFGLMSIWGWIWKLIIILLFVDAIRAGLVLRRRLQRQNSGA